MFGHFYHLEMFRTPKEKSPAELEVERAKQIARDRKLLLEDKVQNLPRFSGNDRQYVNREIIAGRMEPYEFVVAMSLDRPLGFVFERTSQELFTPAYMKKFAMSWKEEEVLLRNLVKNGCVALIDYKPWVREETWIGTPVIKVNMGDLSYRRNANEKIKK
jgi:hypothetical protein